MRSMNIKGSDPLFFASLVIGLKLRHLLEKAWKQKSVSVFFLDKNKLHCFFNNNNNNNNNNIIYIALTPLIDQSALQFIILK